MLAVRLIWPRSIANTPIWQVTLDSRRTRVLVVASGRSSLTGGHAWPRPLSTERTVKYIANSAAKNISSEDSQTIVPTLTRFGLLADVRGATSVVAVATGPLLRHRVGGARPTPRVGSIQFHEGSCIQPRRRHPGPDQARDRPSAGPGCP